MIVLPIPARVEEVTAPADFRLQRHCYDLPAIWGGQAWNRYRGCTDIFQSNFECVSTRSYIKKQETVWKGHFSSWFALCVYFVTMVTWIFSVYLLRHRVKKIFRHRTPNSINSSSRAGILLFLQFHSHVKADLPAYENVSFHFLHYLLFHFQLIATCFLAASCYTDGGGSGTWCLHLRPKNICTNTAGIRRISKAIY